MSPGCEKTREFLRLHRRVPARHTEFGALRNPPPKIVSWEEPGHNESLPTGGHRFTLAKGTKMGFLGFLLLGLIAGAIAKLILPGKQGGGWLITLVLGVVGALLGGFLGSVLFNAPLENFFSIQTWLLAIGGSIIVLLIYGLIVGRRASR